MLVTVAGEILIWLRSASEIRARANCRCRWEGEQHTGYDLKFKLVLPEKMIRKITKRVPRFEERDASAMLSHRTRHLGIRMDAQVEDPSRWSLRAEERSA